MVLGWALVLADEYVLPEFRHYEDLTTEDAEDAQVYLAWTS